MKTDKTEENKDIVATETAAGSPIVATTVPTESAVTELDAPRWLVLTLQILAYAIPFGFLAYVLYINYLPFGYNKTFTIDVGAEGDTDSSQEFYLEPSPDLSERKTAEDGTTYRELNGMANVVFKPNVVLKDAEVTVSVEGEGVEIIPPVIDFDPNSVQWDYNWDFTQGKKPEELGLTGNAYPFDGAMYFDGTARLELASSSDMFEDGPFTVYIEWETSDTANAQQIAGHYNWEIWQNAENIEFRIGRLNDSNGKILSVQYPIENSSNFFSVGVIHKLIAVYYPDKATGRGYIKLYVDNKIAQIAEIQNDIIWKEYGSQNLSLGWTNHNYGKNPFFVGKIFKINISNTLTDFKIQKQTELKEGEYQTIPLRKFDNGGKIFHIEISAKK